MYCLIELLQLRAIFPVIQAIAILAVTVGPPGQSVMQQIRGCQQAKGCIL